MQTVPLILDEPPRQSEFPFARCGYFYIDGEDAPNPWQLGLSGDHYPFSMLALSGILLGPAPGQQFDTLQSFEATIKKIESTGVLVVECGHLWLPAEVLPAGIKRGRVLRTPLDLVQLGLDFARSRITAAEFREKSLRFQGETIISVEESRSLLGWGEAVFALARGRGDGPEPDGHASPKLPPSDRGPSAGGGRIR